MNYNLNETIVALSTPPGQGAIGVIRLSGSNTFEIVQKHFKGKNLSKAESHTAHFGVIYENILDVRKDIDEVVVTIFKNPKSYTGEDIAEISCHGSPFIIQKIIKLMLSSGARMANPGEFTLRAFLNGKLDLSQAEAVADLIASENQVSHELAIKQIRGGFSHEIQMLRQELIDFAALIELELDFGEEDVTFADRTRLVSLIDEIQKVIRRLIDSFHLGNVLKNGVATVIAGRPNAGKSTLLNALLNEERAIVSEIAGTTRDTIEESLNIKGLSFRFVDTAGIRDAKDQIEAIGVSKALQEIQKSTIVLHVVDVVTTTPEMVWQDIHVFESQHSKFVILLNKMDLNPYLLPSDYYKDGVIDATNLLTMSALNKMNIEALKDLLYHAVIENPTLTDQTIVTNSRHFDALNKANESLIEVLNGISNEISSEFIAMDIRQALTHLGAITGEVSTEDLLESIFTRFCIGK